MKVLFVTGNAAKLSLAKNRLSKYGIEVKQQPFDFNESQSMDVEEVAKNKANQIIDKLSKSFIIEDSAFYIEALNGFPGTFLKTAFNTLGDKKISILVKDESNKKAVVKSVLVYANPITKKLKMFTGIYEGKIAAKPRGKSLRGWAVLRIFIPKGGKKTLAELNDGEWKKFLEEFRTNDHYEQFGRWAKTNLKL